MEAEDDNISAECNMVEDAGMLEDAGNMLEDAGMLEDACNMLEDAGTVVVVADSYR